METYSEEDLHQSVFLQLIRQADQYPILTDYTKDPKSLRHQRNSVVKWLLHEVEPVVGPHVVQSAVLLFDLFLSKTQTNPLAFKLVGAVCLLVTAKTHNSISFNLNDLVIECQGMFSRSNIRETELLLLSRMQ